MQLLSKRITNIFRDGSLPKSEKFSSQKNMNTSTEALGIGILIFFWIKFHIPVSAGQLVMALQGSVMNGATLSSLCKAILGSLLVTVTLQCHTVLLWQSHCYTVLLWQSHCHTVYWWQSHSNGTQCYHGSATVTQSYYGRHTVTQFTGDSHTPAWWFRPPPWRPCSPGSTRRSWRKQVRPGSGHILVISDM